MSVRPTVAAASRRSAAARLPERRVHDESTLPPAKKHPERWQVEYRYDELHRFLGFWIVRISEYMGKRCLRLDWLDLSCIRRGKKYNKGGGRNLIRDFRRHYVGGKSLTKTRCEEFFEDEGNFV